jgi:hypothetical protein
MNPLIFPFLTVDGYEETHPSSSTYNCIAWAAGRNDALWWPDTDGFAFWPEGIPREETIEAFVLAFTSVGYEPCDTGDRDIAFEKVALYALEGLPTHAARQLTDGRWTSKLGRGPAITHSTPRGVEGPVYGQVVRFLRRLVAATE